MNVNSNKAISNSICITMNFLGFSEENIRLRSALSLFWSERCSQECNLELKVAGSKREGIAQLFESDIDFMIIDRRYCCADSRSSENDMNIIRTHMAGCPPGYTKLIPASLSCRDQDSLGLALSGFSPACGLDEDCIFVSNTIVKTLREELIGQENNLLDVENSINIVRQVTGPSIPITAKICLRGLPGERICAAFQDIDFVLALPYRSSSLLKTWKKRNRNHQWPAQDVIHEISTTEGFVVPVGHKNSDEQNFEWRICYTIAEQILVSHFNSVQTKLYILLKMIFKQVVNPQCGLISSYLVKNIVFWVCEGNEPTCFTPDKLVDLLMNSLAFLLLCLHSNFLPNYMIPSRNLLGKINPYEKKKLTNILRDLLREGAPIILRLPKIRLMTHIVLSAPELGNTFFKWRDTVEKYFISLYFFFLIHLNNPAMTRELEDNISDDLLSVFMRDTCFLD